MPFRPNIWTFWCHEDLSLSSGKVLLEGHVPGCKSYCRLQWIILCLPIIIVKCDSAGDTVSSVSADEQEARYCSSQALSSTSEVTLVYHVGMDFVGPIVL